MEIVLKINSVDNDQKNYQDGDIVQVIRGILEQMSL